MQSFVKLQKQILSLHLDVVEIEGSRYFCLRDLTHEEFLYEESTELRIDAINDLLTISESVAEKHLNRLRVSIDHLQRSLQPVSDDPMIIYQLYEYCTEANVILKMGKNLDNTRDVVVTSNFSQDLFQELSNRKWAIDILEDFTLNAAHGKKLVNVDSAKQDQSVKLINVPMDQRKPNKLPDVGYHRWAQNVYRDDTERMNSSEIRAMLKPQLPDVPYLRDIIIKKYRHHIDDLRHMLKQDIVESDSSTTYGPVVNSEGNWITDKAVGVALYNALLSTGFILKNKTNFAKALLNEYPTLENTSFIKNSSFKNTAYQEAFENLLNLIKSKLPLQK